MGDSSITLNLYNNKLGQGHSRLLRPNYIPNSWKTKQQTLSFAINPEAFCTTEFLYPPVINGAIKPPEYWYLRYEKTMAPWEELATERED